MPQLDKLSYFSQIFWLFIVFLSLYLILTLIVLPKLNSLIQLRALKKSIHNTRNINFANIDNNSKDSANTSFLTLLFLNLWKIEYMNWSSNNLNNKFLWSFLYKSTDMKSTSTTFKNTGTTFNIKEFLTKFFNKKINLNSHYLNLSKNQINNKIYSIFFIVSPLEQFQITKLISINFGSFDISFTNTSFFMVLVSLVIVLFFTLALLNVNFLSRTNPALRVWQGVAELIYEFGITMILENVGKKGVKYFPFVLTLFLFVLFSNVLGLIPYTFTVTSHLIVTFGLAFTVFVGVTIIGFMHHKIHFFSFFFPPGAPIALAPLLVVIEIISYIFRPLSLSIRLFANMMAGHTLFKIVSGFSWAMSWWLTVFPIGLLFAFTGLEIGVAVLQAYVFTILTCIYLNDSINLH